MATLQMLHALTPHQDKRQPGGPEQVSLTPAEQALLQKVLPGGRVSGDKIDLSCLTEWLQRLRRMDPEQVNPDVQAAKAAMAAAVHRQLMGQQEEAADEESSVWRHLRWATYGTLAVVWILRDGMSVVIGVTDLIPVTLSLSQPLFFLATAVIMTINAALLYFMELRYFRNAVGINSIREGHALFRADRQCIATAERLDNALQQDSALSLSRSRYRQYARFAACLNQDVSAKKYHVPYQETLGEKILWAGVRFFGVALGCFADFFTYSAILTFTAPALLGTPVGMAILGVSLVASFTLYAILYNKNMIRSLSPFIQQYVDNKELLEQFHGKRRNEQDFLRRHEEKHAPAQLKELKKAIVESNLQHKLRWGQEREKAAPAPGHHFFARMMRSLKPDVEASAAIPRHVI